MTIVTLSSIPPRFNNLGAVVKSILNQNAQVDEVCVNIPREYRRFPGESFSMPELPEGARLNVVDFDYGPATKLLPVLAEHEGTEQPIIFCDDDRIIDPDWVGNILKSSAKHKDCCIALSGWDIDRIGFKPRRDASDKPRAKRLRSRMDFRYRMLRLRQTVTDPITGRASSKPSRFQSFQPEGYIDIMEGCGGVLVKPTFMPKEIFNVPERVWSVDDIWFSGMVAMNGVKIWGTNGRVPAIVERDDAQALVNTTIEGLNRQQANAACVKFLQKEYGVWLEDEPLEKTTQPE